jgi:hypothetical protein
VKNIITFADNVINAPPTATIPMSLLPMRKMNEET